MNDMAEFIPATAVLLRYGISDMSLWRWLKDSTLNFPRPVYIGRFRYWKIVELEEWERNLPRERAVQSGKAA
jgi:predicted DNA-binding transcriptional regulator AlpA